MNRTLIIIKQTICGLFRHPWGEWEPGNDVFEKRQCRRCGVVRARLLDTPETLRMMEATKALMPILERLYPSMARAVKKIIRETQRG